ncbi:MAG: choice-of-anchor B family protein [bacterium]|nr:choice-of-anchor B family protein [bacterium]
MQRLLLLSASLILLCSAMKGQVYPASNFTLIGHIDPETGVNADGDKYSACWGWFQSSKNKEYAIACSQSGTYWVDVSNPSTPTVCAYKAAVHASATWREAKTYLHYCYVISDDAGTNSFQIFDMQYLPDSVHKVLDNKSLFSRGHTLWVDGDKLYVASVTYSNSSYSSMNVYSLTNPENPVLLRSLSQDYPFINRVHDMFVRRDTIFASCEYQGLFVFRLSSTYTFTQLGSLASYTASGYNHSSALSTNGKTLVFTDEVPNGLPIKVANVTNLSNIQVLSTINQYPQTTPHNPFIVNDQYCFMSSYQDGLQLFDISTPSVPLLAGYFDTYPQGGGNNNSWADAYNGQWGAYPFFPSKNIFALDQLNGIFMLRTSLYGGAITSLQHEDGGNNFDWSIFPNPSTGSLLFHLPAADTDLISKLVISDVQGNLVLEYHKDDMIKESVSYRRIYLPPLAQGVYFLQVYSWDKLLGTKKLIISN